VFGLWAAKAVEEIGREGLFMTDSGESSGDLMGGE
jgi:hypothetical protein